MAAVYNRHPQAHVRSRYLWALAVTLTIATGAVAARNTEPEELVHDRNVQTTTYSRELLIEAKHACNDGSMALDDIARTRKGLSRVRNGVPCDLANTVRTVP